ncbi:TPA: hypothetical protein DD455_02755 [Candidatus Shapirobacteria bacterium]|nr:hypothetical protein [Candidatus Shapirobacteria bacterium]
MPKEKLLSPPQKTKEKINPPSESKSPALLARIMDGTCFLDCPDPCDDDEQFDHCTQRELSLPRFPSQS